MSAGWKFRHRTCRKAARRAAAIGGPVGAVGVAVVFVYEGGSTSASIATCNGLRDTRAKVKKGAEYALARFDLQDGEDAIADFSRAKTPAACTSAPHCEGEANPHSGATP